MNQQPSLKPTLADGFDHLDVELADLLSRHLASKGFANTSIDVQWWCAAAAMASRAYAAGHVCLNLSDHAHWAGAEGLTPSDPHSLNAFHGFVQRFIEHHAVRGAGLDAASDTLEQAVRASALLVPEGDRVYLRRQWSAECRVAQALAERAQAATPLSREDWVRAQSLLDLWFGMDSGSASDDQQQACRRSAQSRLTVVTGGPGTGKTYTAARLIALLQALRPEGNKPWLKVALAAPTGKAAARLRQALEQAWSTLRGCGLPHEFWEGAWGAIQAPKTVHSLLGQWRRDRRAIPNLLNLTPEAAGSAASASGHLDLLLVDEASMLDLDLLDELLRALPSQARLVLMGDRDQLASVEAGSVMADICLGLRSHAALAPLQNSRRFQGTIGRRARGLQSGDAEVLQEIEQQAQSKLAQLVDQACGPDGWAPCMQALASLKNAPSTHPNTESPGLFDGALAPILRNLDQFRVLAGTRQGPWGVESLNTHIEAALAAKGWIDSGQPWPHGRVLMITRNDESTGLRNGDVGVVVVGRSGGAEFAWLAGQEVRRVGVARLPPSEPAYAMTIHKSQGSEFNRVLLALPDQDSPILTLELLYTGLTRARSEVGWFVPNPALLAQAVRRSTRRMSGLGERLQALLASPPGDQRR